MGVNLCMLSKRIASCKVLVDHVFLLLLINIKLKELTAGLEFLLFVITNLVYVFLRKGICQFCRVSKGRGNT